jgi:nicotinate-nucleotide--dimethylbenzimidazole phosphoribosyltransferase
MSLLHTTLRGIYPLDTETMEMARRRQSQLTKPLGSLGRLEDLSIQLAGITGQLNPPLQKKHVVVMAGDHGVTAAGVSAYPSEVTPQMVLNFLDGGAAINVLARHIGADMSVVDMGVAYDIQTDHANFLNRKIAYGTRNIAEGPAMTPAEAIQAIETGIGVIFQLLDMEGVDLLITGDMGIGNTTPSAAIASVFTMLPVADVTGRGTGLDDEQLAHKIAVIEQAISVNQPKRQDALDVLAKVGGYEIGGIAGLILGAAARRIPVIVDGFISTAGALIAARLAPRAKEYMISGHVSVEQGHQRMLDFLGLVPVLNLDLRLGEGTGAALTASIVEAAAKLLNQMATFGEAGISNKAP